MSPRANSTRATAWVSNGNYAGTRGRNLPLTGFAVRPSGELGERIEIAYEGSFFEGGVVGPKRNVLADDELIAAVWVPVRPGAAQQFDPQAYSKFLDATASDSRFNASDMMAEIARMTTLS